MGRVRPESGEANAPQAQLAFELDAMRRLHELTLRLDRTADLHALLVEVLDAIIALHRADFGNIQLFDSSRRTLLLVAQRGFDAAFERRFAEIGALDHTSCGQALAAGKRVVVADIETDPGFAPFREAARCYGFSAAQSTPLTGAEGEPLGMVSTYFREARPFSDSDHRLTDLYARQASEAIVRHRREDALRASQSRLQRVIETESVGILFFSPEGVVLDANEAFLRMIGWPREDALDGRLDWRALTPREWWPRAEDNVARLAREGRLGPHERPYLTRDGARRWMLFSGHNLGDGTNVGYALDISERKRAGDALRESEARFRGFGDASSDVLWIRDANSLRWEYLSAASESVYGLEPERALAADSLSDWLDLILPDDRDLAVEKLRSVARGERVMLEYRVRRASDGEIRWLRETMFPLASVRGRVKRIGGIGEDITDEKETADRLTVLVGELQHRTRNLMAVVRSIAQRTARGSRSLQDFKIRFGDRMDALARVQALLSRLQEGDRVPFDELVGDELRAHQGARVTLEGPPGVLLRSSTVQILAMAIHELVTNAMKYGALAQPKGRLTVRWGLEPAESNGRRRLRVEWIESGVTMPPGSDTHGGAGRELIERALPYQLDAETSYALGEDGVRCVIRLPVSEHTPRE
ncbi:MAG TPA: PAS domain S-box protein [Caulobacteraceae bacterium]|jgi:two-component system CheB/CheR fusion protein